MKHLFVTILLFVHYQAIWGQTDPGGRLLQTDNKAHHYYVDLKDTAAWVYTMGYYHDFGGSDFIISRTDTLQKQPDSSYSGRYFQIIREKEGVYMLRISGKNRKFQLNTVSDTNLANYRLNKAWYLGHYINLSDTLNKAYSLNYLSFVEAFHAWEKLPEHEMKMPYLQFREVADKRLKQVKDSVTAVQEECTRLKNYIVQNIDTLDYTTLKDSVVRLTAVSGSPSRYCRAVAETVALRHPEYFFRLAEDLPEHREELFLNGIYNKRAFSGLASVEGHDEAKKEFLKKRKAMRVLTYQAIGTSVLGYALIIGLVVVLL